MRIGIASLALEANTFNPTPTTLKDFQSNLFLQGEELWSLKPAHHELGGFLSGLSEPGVEVVPLIAAGAAPGGTLEAGAFDTLRSMLQSHLDQAGKLDGILLAPHGAMVAEGELDADGCWLEQVRNHVGPDVPIIATIDPHANLSRRMIAVTDAILAYKSNPHLDQRQRGEEAARLMIQAVRGEIELNQAACFPPLQIEIERQHSSTGAYAELLAISKGFESEPGHLSSSIVLGFPYADVPEMGSAVIVVTNGKVASPEGLAVRLADEMWNRRDALRSQLVSMKDAARQVRSRSETTCLLDMGDNVGGGSPGDCTVLFEVLIQEQAGPTLGVIIDPESAGLAHAAGVGRSVELQIGGKLPGTVGNPISGLFQVLAISDGIFFEKEPRHGGQQQYDQGLTAVVQRGELTLVLISNRVPPFSLQQILHLGVEPARFRVIVAKGVHAPVAAYTPVSKHFLRVNSPGLTAAEMSNFNYVHRRRPLYPCERETPWTPAVTRS